MKVFFFLFISISFYAKTQNLIQPLSEVKRNKLSQWRFYDDNGKFNNKTPKEYRWVVEDNKKTFIAYWNRAKIISWEALVPTSTSTEDFLEFSIELKVSNKNALKNIDFEFYNGNIINLIFRLSKVQIDTIKAQQWCRITFKFRPTCRQEKSAIRMNSFVLGSGSISVRDVSLLNEIELIDKNLVRNGSFEEYYFFPTGDRLIYRNIFANWNDRVCVDSSVASPISINVGTDRSYLDILIGSDYFCQYDKCIIIPFDGHFCSQIPNSYLYDNKKVDLSLAYNISYLQSELKTNLLKDSIYLLQFMILLDPRSEWVDNSLGVRFTDGQYNPNSEVDFRTTERILPTADIVFFDDPILTSNQWTKLSFEFKATGKESNICFGVFNNPAHKRLQIKPKIKVKGETYQSVFYLDWVVFQPCW